MLLKRLVAVDVETTGADPARDRIIEIGVVVFEGGREVAARAWLTDPGRPIPLRFLQLTGIRPEDVRGQPPAEAVLPELLDLVGDGPLVAHNAAFDAAFLGAACRRAGLPPPGGVIDTVELARLAFPLARSYRLAALAETAGIPLVRAHRAVEDARACGRVALASLECIEGLEPGVLQDMARLVPPASPIAPILERARALRAGERPRERTLWVAPAPFPIHGGDDDGPASSAAPLAPAEVEEVFGPDGVVARAFSRGAGRRYEQRPEQLEMARQVAAALQDGRILVVEAGTGTGKSLAYLVPSLLWAERGGGRIVISTHTITLQEQLWEREIPFLQGALGREDPVPIALVKGRSNYVCLRKWEEAVEGADLATGPEEREFLLRTVPWIAATRDADRAELQVTAGQEEYWRRIQSETETCLGQKCRWYRAHCFAFRARQRARDARVLVVNHALLISDLKAGGGVLPPYEHVVIDEAHHLEAVATEHLGTNIGRAEVLGSLARLLRTGRSDAAGVLAALQRRSRELGARAEPLAVLVQTGRCAVDELFDLAGTLTLERGTGQEEGGRVLRLTDSVRALPEWEAVRVAAENATGALERLSKGLGELAEFLEEHAGAGQAGLDSLRMEVRRGEAALMAAAYGIGEVLAGESPHMVRWVEAQPPRSAGERPPGVSLRAAPIHVGPVLRSLLWDRVRSAVLTSATLTVGGRFDHVLGRLGLDGLGERLRVHQARSPFHYEEQALLLVPDDIPTPRAGEPAFQAAVSQVLADLLPALGGRTLVLFTSHRHLQRVYSDLKSHLESHGLLVLAQGLDGSRGRLVEEFRSGERTVLLGSASFWEGVDIPGADLSYVVVVRLPFHPPGDPVMAARAEDLEARGLSAFHHLSLPQAVIRFKQGFGRLIRTGTDRGVVVVLDRRIDPRQAPYGRHFLQSLPGPRIATVPAGRLGAEAVRFVGVDPVAPRTPHGAVGSGA